MNTATFEESKLIYASPSAVYQLLADYRVGHMAILPKPYFTDMRVVAGGFGDGTVIDVDMEVYGLKRSLHMEVSEPEKGKVLVETDTETGTITHFIFDDSDEGCYLTIRTTMYFADGFVGFLEKMTTPAITRNIYRKELQNIAEYLERKPELA
jgi:hypothetical protein